MPSANKLRMPYPPKQWGARADVATSIIVISLCTVLAVAVRDEAAQANSAIVYLLGVLAVAVRCRRDVAIVNAILSVLAFHYFCVPHFDSFRLKDYDDLITLAGMLLVALVTSTQTAKIRNQAKEAMEREQRTAALFALSQELAKANNVVEIVQAVERIASGVFEANVRVFVPDDFRVIDSHSESARELATMDREKAAAQSVLDTGQSCIESERSFVPLMCAGTPVGVMSLMPYHAKDRLHFNSPHFFEIFCSQVATGIERAHGRAAARNAEIAIQTERTRNALLSAVSHDLKTPLASIYGSATSLLLEEQRLNKAESRELIKSIADESERMNQLIVNLLEMTRLEAGGQTKRDWFPLEEIIGAALTRLETALDGRTVTTQLRADLPLIYMDGVLIQEVFFNLVDNAIKHTPAGTPIVITAVTDGTTVTVTVADAGPGFASGDENRVFEKFFRGKPASARGAGLGLAICRAIIDGHSGRIVARNGENGGAVLCFELPIGGVPPQITVPTDVVHE